MADPDFDRFCALLQALDATTSPPPPRDVGEHFLAAAAAALAGWRLRNRRVQHAVPLGEHVELRQRARVAEDEVAELRRRLDGVQAGSLTPSPRSARRRAHHP